MTDFAIVIPTLNGGERFTKLADSIKCQDEQARSTLVIDSGSTDDTVNCARSNGFHVISIDKQDFNHGATRQMAANMLQDEILIYLTQDAILAKSDSIHRLIDCFEDASVGAAYGRQLPHDGAGPFGTHARIFNYPAESKVKSIADANYLGMKTAFISNSFAAYRRTALMAVGGFPGDTILSEDMYVAAKMLLNNWKVTYSAEAAVFHSHDYSCMEEFRRYFDIGVFHSRERWIRERFGQAEGEGIKFVKSEMRYLWQHGEAALIPIAIIRTVFKLFGYRLGVAEQFLPLPVKRHLSMNRLYWNK